MKDSSRQYHSRRRHGKEEASVSSFRFPLKLHLLLENSEHSHIISWLPDGKSFRCHDKDLFTKQIMPEYFGTTNFKAFQRNLNLWGFTRVSKGPQKDVLSHPLFLKGYPALCQGMKRMTLKGTGRGNRAPRGGVDVYEVQNVVSFLTHANAHHSSKSSDDEEDSSNNSSFSSDSVKSPATKSCAPAIASLSSLPGSKKNAIDRLKNRPCKTASSSSTIMMPKHDRLDNQSILEVTTSSSIPFGNPAFANLRLEDITASSKSSVLQQQHPDPSTTLQQVTALLSVLKCSSPSLSHTSAPTTTAANLLSSLLLSANPNCTPATSRDMIQLLLLQKQKAEQEWILQQELQRIRHQQWEQQLLQQQKATFSNTTTASSVLSLLLSLAQQQPQQQPMTFSST